MEAMIAYMMDFVPDACRKDVVFHACGEVAITRVSALKSDNLFQTGRFYHLAFPLAPMPLTDINGKKHCFVPRTAVIFPPGIHCRMDADIALARNHYYILMSQELGDRVIRELYNAPLALQPLECPVPPPVRRLLPELEEELRGRRFGYAAAARFLSGFILASLLRQVRPDQSPQGDDSAVNRALSYVHTHYGADISLDDLAAFCHISPSSLIRQFCRHTGRTPHRYIMEYRLGRARGMLSDTLLAVSEIARMCGFVSASHFADAYRRRYGVTPSETRSAAATVK